MKVFLFLPFSVSKKVASILRTEVRHFCTENKCEFIVCEGLRELKKPELNIDFEIKLSEGSKKILVFKEDSIDNFKDSIVGEENIKNFVSGNQSKFYLIDEKNRIINLPDNLHEPKKSNFF